jgi:hypothetical protein
MTHSSHLILSDQSDRFAGTAAKVPQDILKCVAKVRVRMLDVTGLEVFGARVLHVREFGCQVDLLSEFPTHLSSVWITFQSRVSKIFLALAGCTCIFSLLLHLWLC